MNTPQIHFHGPNMGYVLERYEQYRQDPNAVSEGERDFFAQWSPPQNNGAIAIAEAVARSTGVETSKVIGAVNYAAAIRTYGHLAAQLNPLGYPPPGDPQLQPESHGITDEDLRTLPAAIIDSVATQDAYNALEAVAALRMVYTGSIGVDNDHIVIPEEREWLRDVIETRRYRFEGTPDEARALLDRLAQVEAFETFIGDTYGAAKYRFSIEGLDMMVPMLDEMVRLALTGDVEVMPIAMAHRGRLNVLAHVMQKPHKLILADFRDAEETAEMNEAIGWQVDDVKYHKAWTHHISRGDNAPGLMLTMPANPSHLEAVDPVAVGMARAAGTTRHQRGPATFNPARTMQILIHGDAAFIGQGIVAETFNLSFLPGYHTGGTIHVIANNQLGFTTLPRDARSTLYASDLAKGYRVPVIHVNADDPAACIEVARIAFEYQHRFEKDFLIDLVGYRRHGHNELDQPGFTQPLMYKTIDDHARVRQLWASRLQDMGIINQGDDETLITKHRDIIQAVNDSFRADDEDLLKKREKPEPKIAARTDTTVPFDTLQAINDGLRGTYEGFNFYPGGRLEKNIMERRTAFNTPDEPNLDWAAAEELAYATILADGIPIRLTGQDSERGTFAHRHAVLHDAESGEPLVPLHQLPQARASFEIRNSPLSEAAALGFEYGYNIQSQDTLIIWEAQYGDFVNGAQTIVDEFIVSGREKWNQTPSLVMLLPHGYEGKGPDHSSGRLERFLQLAAKQNMRVANPTSAAQFFHLLRRQALLLKRDPLPLIVMTPKSFLRRKEYKSSPMELAQGGWHPVIDDPQADPEQVTRLVFCSGKYYFDLISSDYRALHPDVAIVRIEQLYPFPAEQLRAVVSRYANVTQIVYAQEEPKNMGAFDFIQYRLKKLVGPHVPVNYTGRRRSGTPAEGSAAAHKVNQAMIIEYAFRWDFPTKSVKRP